MYVCHRYYKFGVKTAKYAMTWRLFMEVNIYITGKTYSLLVISMLPIIHTYIVSSMIYSKNCFTSSPESSVYLYPTVIMIAIWGLSNICYLFDQWSDECYIIFPAQPPWYMVRSGHEPMSDAYHKELLRHLRILVNNVSGIRIRSGLDILEYCSEMCQISWVVFVWVVLLCRLFCWHLQHVQFHVCLVTWHLHTDWLSSRWCCCCIWY